jgi:hypothetical protein
MNKGNSSRDFSQTKKNDASNNKLADFSTKHSKQNEADLADIIEATESFPEFQRDKAKLIGI